MEGVYINGTPQGITFHETDDYTIYPAAILTVNKNRFTKHYFLGDKRVASRIGTGRFNNVYGVNGSHVTAGQQDYAARMSQIEAQREEYYKELGIAPGVPTMKGAYGDPENTGVGYNTIIKELGDHSVPQGWIQTPKTNQQQGSEPGAPISWDDPSTPDNPQPGYGYIANDTTREETYYFHSDHLGSTSYITDDKGNITQYDAYLPYGELLVDEHSSSEELPYKFNGKELDEETGLYYYGARYMNPVTSLWYGADPLREKFPGTTVYSFCVGNPLKYIDRDVEKPSAANLIKVAKLLGVEIAAIRAVFETEVQGNTYLSDGRVKILYERHYFSRLTGGKYDNDSDISSPKPYNTTKSISPSDKYGSHSNQYRRLEKAMKLDEEAAYASVSYGSFQIMGANYKLAGYDSAKEFGEAMLHADENTMLDVFANFIKGNPKLLNALRDKDWKTFALKYNGPGYKANNYDTKMSDNYNLYKNDPFKGYSNVLPEVVVYPQNGKPNEVE